MRRMLYQSVVGEIIAVLHLFAGCLQDLVQRLDGLFPAHVAELSVGFFGQSEVSALRHVPVIFPDELPPADGDGILIEGTGYGRNWPAPWRRERM